MLQVCPRCCLRHAGVRGEIYASAAPQASELYSTVRANTDTALSHTSAERPAASAAITKTQPRGAAQASVSSMSDASQAQHNSCSPSNISRHIAAMPRSADDKAGTAENGQHAGPGTGQDSSDQSKAAPCSICLGVLQCLDSLLPAPPSEDVTKAVQQWDAGSGRAWHPLSSCQSGNIAAHVKCVSAHAHILV